MFEIKKKLYYVLYSISKYMPKSNARLSFGAKKIRAHCARGFCEYVGENVNIEKGATFSRRIRIGDNSGIGINCNLQGMITIGSNVMMGPEVWIYTRNHKHDSITEPMINQGFEEEKPVVIGDDVWIGSRVTILPGVKIGNGAIIGASSVVTKDVMPFSIVGGNPAVLLKNR